MRKTILLFSFVFLGSVTLADSDYPVRLAGICWKESNVWANPKDGQDQTVIYGARNKVKNEETKAEFVLDCTQKQQAPPHATEDCGPLKEYGPWPAKYSGEKGMLVQIHYKRPDGSAYTHDMSFTMLGPDEMQCSR